MEDVRSPQNVAHVTTVCRRFLSERFQVTLDADALAGYVHDAISEVVARGKHQSQSLEEANKLVIVRVKDRVTQPQTPPILSQQLSQPSLPSSSQPPAGQPSASSSQVPSITLSHTAHFEDLIQDEDEFFKKLQDLENQRNLPPPPQAANTIASPISAPSPSTSLVPQVASSVVYLPPSTAPTRLAKSVIINGSDRMWEYFTKRSTLVWSGPIPPNVPQVNFASLLLPKKCAELTPVVVVEITGAAGNSTETICTLSSSTTNTGVWDTWVPCGEALGQVKALSCPWTIKLLDNFRRPLELGEDALTIKQVARLYNGNTKITFEDHSHTNSGLCKGAQLLIRCKGDIYVTVINYDPSNNAIEVTPIGSDVAIAMSGAKVCNLHQQATIVLTLMVSKSE